MRSSPEPSSLSLFALVNSRALTQGMQKVTFLLNYKKAQLSNADKCHQNCVQIVGLCKAIAQEPRCKDFAVQRRNREAPNYTRASNNYCAKPRCTEFAAQRRNPEAKIKHGTATQEQCCKECGAAAQSRSARLSKGQQPLPHNNHLKGKAHESTPPIAKYVQQRNMCTIRRPTLTRTLNVVCKKVQQHEK